jgi:hypothetical protein
LVKPQNHGRWFVSGLASKPLGQVFWFGPQNRQLRFGDLGLKITAMISWFVPQNQVGYGLSVAPQNQQEDEDGVGHPSRSNELIHMEASGVRVSQSSLKTGAGVVWMVHVTSSRRLRRVEAEDGRVDVMGCIGPFYPNFIIFIVLGSRDILFF